MYVGKWIILIGLVIHRNVLLVKELVVYEYDITLFSVDLASRSLEKSWNRS